MEEIKRRGTNGVIEYPLERREEGYRLYAAGRTTQEISDALDIPYHTIARWSSRCKWKLRRATTHVQNSSGVDTPKEKTPEIPLGPSLRIEGQTFGEKQKAYKDTLADEALRIAETIRDMPGALLVVNADKIAKLDAIARKGLALEESKPTTVIQIGLLTGAAGVSVAPRVALKGDTEGLSLTDRPVCQQIDNRPALSLVGVTG